MYQSVHVLRQVQPTVRHAANGQKAAGENYFPCRMLFIYLPTCLAACTLTFCLWCCPKHDTCSHQAPKAQSLTLLQDNFIGHLIFIFHFQHEEKGKPRCLFSISLARAWRLSSKRLPNTLTQKASTERPKRFASMSIMLRSKYTRHVLFIFSDLPDI